MLDPSADVRAVASAEAVRAEALARGWIFHSAEVVRDAGGVLRLERSSWPAASPEELFGTLHPDGLVVWRWSVRPSEVRALAGGRMPAVFVHRNRDGRSPGEGVVSVHWDADSVASLAARALLASGYGDYAFAAWRVDADFSRDYGAAFRRHVERAGKRFCGMSGTDGDDAAGPSGKAGETALVRWLKALPKPCGVFAANDIIGEAILSTCAALGIAVPDDVAVVATGNREYICEATSPTLSSVALDRRVEGRAAVALLAEWFDHPGRTPRSRAVPASHVAVRMSARFSRDRRVAAALERIRIHACEEGFGPPAVARTMGVSRTHADRLFRTALGHTILDEIHAVRLDRAKDLLRDGRHPGVVAAACGYGSPDDFRRVFRLRAGATPRQWALAHR